MDKGFEMKIDEEIADDGWGRHRDDEVIWLFAIGTMDRNSSGPTTYFWCFSDGTHR